MSLKQEKQYYIRGSVIDVEEDLCHEFKGHRSICEEEMDFSLRDSETGKLTRKPISRNICAFLNTGKGGIIYLGVLDGGEVFGIPRTPYQKDHLLLSIHDAVNRFTPPVPRQLYDVRFIPVIDSKDVENFNLSKYSNQNTTTAQREKPHRLQTHRYCWCDSDAQARFLNGVIPDEYVVEIEIFPWSDGDSTSKALSLCKDISLHPLFKTETGESYIRGQGGVHQMSSTDVVQISLAHARFLYQKRIADLQQQIKVFKNLQK